MYHDFRMYHEPRGWVEFARIVYFVITYIYIYIYILLSLIVVGTSPG